MSLRSLFARIKAASGGYGSRGATSGLNTTARSIRFFANRGPGFEPPLADDPEAEYKPRARAIAFYLPQFHRFPENDAWWGTGFTEWRNVARGTPRYQGHYQPRIPADLGCYDLNDVNVIGEQAVLAERNGIEAFCFYYYWFNGKRLLEKPLDLFAENPMPIDFCLMWANENWTRTWDGLDNEVLIQQDYREEDETAFIKDTARYMANPKYLRVANRPVFIVYRASLLPDARATLARWRERWTELLGVRPWLLMAQSFDEVDPRPYGLDGAVEFPPHKICKGLGNLRSSMKILDKDFTGLVRDYNAVVDQSLNLPVPDYLEIKTVSPSWDNDARREARGTSWFGATPARFERWLTGAIDHANAHPFAGEPLVFINAWNEWAEGAYLEPDVHYGHAVLNATKRAVYGLRQTEREAPILLLGHDAHRHGSQLLLLNMARILTQGFNLPVHIVLKEGGDLVREYQKFSRTTILEAESLLDHVDQHGTPLNRYRAAIANTTVSGDLIPTLKRAGVPSVVLVHELPTLIRDYGLQRSVQEIAASADNVVFPAEMVRNGFESFGYPIRGNTFIKPQGTYLAIERNTMARHRLRKKLGISESEKLIINVGYADLRKGFDLFIQTARQAMQDHPNWHFAWIGNLHSDMRAWVQKDLENSDFRERVHLPGFIAGNTDHFSAADALLLTSREDPYPTVALEALEVGIPFIAYQGCSGLDHVASQFGAMVPRGDVIASIDALDQLMNADTDDVKQQRTDYVRSHCQLDQYLDTLLIILGLIDGEVVPEAPKNNGTVSSLVSSRRA